ncbi:MAG: hypothetical protein HY898_33350 [Deltaproteobacteria bacterium]|nr:hypothetical protein [Deltaproteobacteria bacterium]
MIRAARSLVPRLALAAGVFVALSAAARPSPAYQRTLKYMTTGNGFGFQVYDADAKKLVEFLEHPYRFLGPRPGQLQSDGIIRRNLMFDMYFGVKGSGGAGWLNTGIASEPDYVDQSNIIRAPISLGGMSTESFFFSPFGYQGNALVAVIKAATATDAYILLNFHMGSGENNPGADGELIKPVDGVDGAVQETGAGGGALVYVGLSGLDHADCGGAYGKVQAGQDLADNANCSGNDQSIGFQKKLGADGMWAVGVQFVENAADAAKAAGDLKAWANNRTPQQMVDDTQAEFNAWRKPPPAQIEFKTDELKIWRQSETVLRMGQVLEPYTDTRKSHGMMLASLPHGEWHSGWVRDGMYAIVALARSGHAQETKYALDFLINAAPVGTGKYKDWFEVQDYRISTVRYFGSGEEDADFSGQPTPNIEVDGWGMALWAARQYVDATGDVGWLNEKTKIYPDKTNYQVMVEGIADKLAGYLEPTGIVKKDSSIWEVHQGKARHYAYTTLAAARGFCDMAALAARTGNDADSQKYRELSQKVGKGFVSTFVDQNNAFVGSLEGITPSRADAAVIEVFTWNIITKYDAVWVQPTFDLLNKLQVSSGGYKRNDEGLSTYDEHEWILIDLRMSDALRRAGKTERADQLLDTIVGKAAVNFGLVPELYSAVSSEAPIGNYWGSIPMVGYGAGAYMLTLFDRAGLIEPNDCGTKPPPPTDGGTGGAGGTGNGGAGGGGGDGGTGQSGQAGTGGCDDILGCGGTDPNAASDAEIPRKGACMCRIDDNAARTGEWLSLTLLPLAYVVRRLARRRGQVSRRS